MSSATITRFDLEGPCIAVSPATLGALPVCLFLYGGGGTVETLADLAPLLDRAWSSGSLAPMVVACAGVPPFSFYLDHGDARWETLVAEQLLEATRARFETTRAAGLVGISMGGYGALKIAFARPSVFSVVAALEPMIEPSLRSSETPLRNRFHYPPEVPPALLGAARDEALYASDHPACRARRNADAIRAHDLAIYLDAASRDALNAHDGAEHLHRVLWELDLVHEYHLFRDADHVGPTVAPRLESALAWVGRHLGPSAVVGSEEERALRAMVAPARAAAKDPTMDRTYGVLGPLAYEET